MQRNQRKAGVVLSYVAQIVHIVSAVVYTPIMLRILGQSEYGTYQLVESVVSYLGLLSLGFGASYVRYYARYKAKDDEIGIAKLNGMFLVIFCVIAMIASIGGFAMINNIHGIFGDGLTEAEYATAKVLMQFMVFNLALSFPISVFDSIVTAHEEFVFQKIIILLQYLLNPFITLPLLLLGHGSIGMVVVTTALTIAKALANVWFCLKKLKVRFLFKGFDISLFRELSKFTFFIFLNQIIDQINWSVDKFLLGRMVGTVGVSIYGLASQLNSMYLQFSGAVSNAFVPKVNHIVSSSDDNKVLTNLFCKVGRVQFIILSLIITGYIFFGHSFMILWGGTEYSESYYVGLFLLIPVTIPLIQNLGIEIQRAKNMHKARSIALLIISVLNIGISIPLINLLGAVGAAVGTAISLFGGNIVFMNWYYHKKIGLDMIHFWKEIASFGPAMILPVIVGIAMNRFCAIHSYLDLAVVCGLYCVIYILSMWFAGMNNEERGLIQPLINRFIKKKK